MAKKAKTVPQTETQPAEEQQNDGARPDEERPTRETTHEERRIAESREVLKSPLPHGQKFFESPEGYVVVGEADRDHVFCRHANGGKGMLINPRR